MNKNRKYVHNILKQYITPDFIPKAFMLRGEYLKNKKLQHGRHVKKNKIKFKKNDKMIQTCSCDV